MKRLIQSSTVSDVIMKSDDGLFEVVERSGVGMNRTPWTGLDVISHGDAEKHVVDIRLRSVPAAFKGPENPVTYKYDDVYVSHGMRMSSDTLEDTARYIEVLQSALEFAKKIKESGILESR